MKIGYYFADQNPHRDRTLGITNYSQELIDSILGISKTKIVTISSRSSASTNESENFILPWRTDHSLGRLAADHLHPLITRKQNVDLWHYPKGYLPVFPGRNAPIVTTIHDTILDYYQRNFSHTRSNLEWRYWIGLLKHSISASNLILTLSQSSKEQITSFAFAHDLPLPPIEVAYLGSSKERYLQLNGNSEPAKRDHLVAFVSRLPHKGTSELLEHWTEWVSSQAHASKMTLKLVGSPPNECMAQICGTSSIELLPFQTADALNELIRTSRGVIVPSLIEGFGLPVLESYYLSTPVMVVAGTACDEILDDPSLAFRLGDQDSFNEVLNRLIETPREFITRKQLELFQKFSWRKVAERTLAAYGSVFIPKK